MWADACMNSCSMGLLALKCKNKNNVANYNLLQTALTEVALIFNLLAPQDLVFV